VGGEWGGSILLPYEFARSDRHRALLTSLAQAGMGLGVALSSATVGLILKRFPRQLNGGVRWREDEDDGGGDERGPWGCGGGGGGG
jgi:hypothetical protein